mgnify:FL=1|jgi:hypothetical protein|tara:strand:+ start:299 stop:544 length:246 start_codon:yes stop_codon:yes gene_type:complete
MSKEKRYVATFEVYLYAHNDKHAISKAKLIAERERYKYPSQDMHLEKLHSVPFASFDIKEIDLSQKSEDEAFGKYVENLNK